jgi:hypothetical protein
MKVGVEVRESEAGIKMAAVGSRAVVARALTFALLCLGVTAGAQNLAIDRFTISGGGGVSTGSVYSVNGTVGEPGTGKSSGGNFTLESGFWSVAVAVQTAGAPTLILTRSGNDVILSWPADAAGFLLEETATVNAPASWTGVAQGIVVSNGQNVVTLQAAAGYRFYRLKKP